MLFVSGAGFFVWYKLGFPNSEELKLELLPSLADPTPSQTNNDPNQNQEAGTNVPSPLTPETEKENSLPKENEVPEREPEKAQVVPPAMDSFRSARIVSTIFEAQLVLVSKGFSPGSIDGVLGNQTRAALEKFQLLSGLTVTGTLDTATKTKLILKKQPLSLYQVTEEDLRRIMTIPSTWLGKSQVDRLDYQSVLELVAEKHASHPSFIKQLNPGLDWDHLQAGTQIRVPNVTLPEPSKAGRIRIDLSDRLLEVYDASGGLMALFPCSIAKKVEKRPQGELKVTRIAENPNYRFNPEIFTESPEAQSIGKPLMIPPGPNNPVGSAWISLDLPAYGIHGTPLPEAVGRTESHGCFRLSNWNADFLVKVVRIGTPVSVEP